MSRRDRLSGNEAAALAIRQINPDVIAAFPITPSTEIPQYISQYKANGEIDTEFVTVESEHSAISACLGAEAAGVRAMTATSSCGLALMCEILYVASSARQPIVMAVVNRALTGPININNDHSDAMGVRDSGWVQLYSENAQEAYDNLLMAHRIAEHAEVRLPLMVCQDGFITSHAVENIVLEDDAFVRQFVGEYRPEKYLLNEREALSIGSYDVPAYYMEHKRQQAEAIQNALRVVREVSADYSRQTGRPYDVIECYKMEDAAYAIVAIGSSAGTAKAAVDRLRGQGEKVGLVKVRCFHPFPAEDVCAALRSCEAIAVMDKAESFSACGGPLGAEIKSALYGYANAKIINYIYGLGGRDVLVDTFYEVFADLKAAQAPSTCRYIGVRDSEQKGRA